MKIGTIYEITSRMRIAYDSENKQRLVFRKHIGVLKKHHEKEVPYAKANPEDPALRYYVCKDFLVPMATYLPYLENTKEVSDHDVLKLTDNTLDEAGRMDAYKIAAMRASKYSPYPSTFISNVLDACITKLHKKGMPLEEIADLLYIGTKRVSNILTPKSAKSGTGQRKEGAESAKGKRSLELRPEIADAPELGAVKHAAAFARRKAFGLDVGASFLLTDVFPTMYDIQGNSGRMNGHLIVPRVCPVLRIPLDYDVFENRKALNKVRVWRKTPGPDGKAALAPDNVIIMSTIAAWAIEGAYAAKKLKDLTHDMQMALAEWQGKYGTRTVPREAKIGRPRKS